MTAVEFSKVMEYDYSTVMRWLKDGIVPGAKFVEVSGQFGVWQIPESALKEIQLPRPGRKRGLKKRADDANDLPFNPPASAAKPTRRARVKQAAKKTASKKGGAAK